MVYNYNFLSNNTVLRGAKFPAANPKISYTRMSTATNQSADNYLTSQLNEFAQPSWLVGEFHFSSSFLFHVLFQYRTLSLKNVAGIL